MSVHESGEMYLEAILVLTQKHGSARSVDVSEYLGYSKPSVSRAVGILRKEDYITVEDNGCLLLTQKGKEIAEMIYERHRILTDVLIKLGVNQETATNDACRLEHAMSDESFQAIKRYAYSVLESK